ncbi:MAG: Tex family protein [Candidatus Krumholzibacteriia bacterium]
MTETQFTARAARDLALSPRAVTAVAALLAEGATVPFIARYRKELTGSLDEVQIAAVRDRLAEIAALEARREAILGSLAERDLLTAELAAAVREAATLTALEDVYLPWRPKRRTRATMARERGLEPLAALLLLQERGCDPEQAARPFVRPDRDVPDAEAALAGARDIIAEQVSEDAAARDELRTLLRERGLIRSRVRRGKEEAGQKFRDWFEFEEPVARTVSHRVLAMRRGEAEDVLTVRITVDEETVLNLLERRYVRGRGPASAQVALAVSDGWKRLLSVSLETELRLELKTMADTEAIRVFAENLRELLLAAPLGQQPVLALDPGFRTGCKLVVLDAQGRLLHHDTVYPHPGGDRVAAAAATVERLAARHQVAAVAIGNGTAGRETEAWVRGLALPAGCAVVMVNESGASVYSASEVARQEFPDHDVTVRGAVSIGRRLQDPLAELVKLDPKVIGVGQYQHDVDQKRLKQALDDTVMSCVNRVGVEVNSASKELLSYVSGLGPQLAANIVAHRDANGPFATRRKLLDVARLGPKAFEQAAGFLRVRASKNPLDASAVHPERYAVVEQMAHDLGVAVGRLVGDAELVGRLELRRYVSDEVGLPTLEDIRAELLKPGRDPRQRFEVFQFADVHTLSDLEPGMRVPGIVTNVTNFGAFVDVGVHQDGLVHVSQLADRFVRDPAEVVKVQQQVMVTVLEVDLERRRISLSLKAGA